MYLGLSMMQGPRFLSQKKRTKGLGSHPNQGVLQGGLLGRLTGWKKWDERARNSIGTLAGLGSQLDPINSCIGS
jgi:hypothetical protein